MARPRVLLNCAASLDGCLAAPDGSPLRFSDDTDMARVHRMRAGSDAILVGIGTVLADDPSLRVKSHLADGVDPLRVVLDSAGRTPPEAQVLDGSAPTLIVHGPGVERSFAPAEQVPVTGAGGTLELESVLRVLWDRQVRTVMVEGGGKVLRSFLEAGLWDHFSLYVAPVLVGGGPALWPRAGADAVPPFGLPVESVEAQGEGALWRFAP